MEETAGCSLGLLAQWYSQGHWQTYGPEEKTLLFYLGLSCAVYTGKELKMHSRFLTSFGSCAPSHQLMKAMSQLSGKKAYPQTVSPGCQPSDPRLTQILPGDVQSLC